MAPQPSRRRRLDGRQVGEDGRVGRHRPEHGQQRVELWRPRLAGRRAHDRAQHEGAIRKQNNPASAASGLCIASGESADAAQPRAQGDAHPFQHHPPDARAHRDCRATGRSHPPRRHWRASGLYGDESARRRLGIQRQRRIGERIRGAATQKSRRARPQPLGAAAQQGAAPLPRCVHRAHAPRRAQRRGPRRRERGGLPQLRGGGLRVARLPLADAQPRRRARRLAAGKVDGAGRAAATGRASSAARLWPARALVGRARAPPRLRRPRAPRLYRGAADGGRRGQCRPAAGDGPPRPQQPGTTLRLGG
mmetsp:Transcript_34921/g.112135  ORF Transcript_34921/g.112135 Transcript_34921/m.112135 type:complete len:307 (-) Transcript_34921:516-1436(-)